jgi:hypothetical protein
MKIIKEYGMLCNKILSYILLSYLLECSLKELKTIQVDLNKLKAQSDQYIKRRRKLF